MEIHARKRRDQVEINAHPSRWPVYLKRFLRKCFSLANSGVYNTLTDHA
jgi:hypothetical protein